MNNLQIYRKEFRILLLLSVLLISANIHSLSLRSLDDCFYARKGVELGRSGRFFTVTWNYRPTFQNPPLQFWILGRAFAFFGENDFAARLPSLLMAIGILLCTYRIGSLTVGTPAAVAGVAFLMISPDFISNARRCMMEIPLTFWISLAVLILLEGIQRPRIHLLFGFPVAAAILTKSILGLLPIWIYLTAAVLGLIRMPNVWLIAGSLMGIVMGASWSLHEASLFGQQAVREHYLGEIANRSARKLPWLKAIFGYPLILFTVFQPVILPAAAGAVTIYKGIRENPRLGILLIWILIPLVFYNLSGTRSSRYIFPVFPPLALCAGYCVETFSTRFSSLFRHWLVPALLVVVTALFWINPLLLSKDENRELKSYGHLIKERIPEEESVPYLGDRYWNIANPLLYYCERLLQTSSDSAPDVLKSGRKAGILIVDHSRAAQVMQLIPKARVLLQSEDWLILEVLQSRD